jgi:hypothetical protein
MCRATVVANARRTSDVGVMAAAAAAAANQAEAVTGLSAALQTRVVPVVALQDLLAGMKARLQVRDGLEWHWGDCGWLTAEERMAWL